MVEQADVDRQNTAFWSELCGSSAARALGITGDEPDALRRFDEWYFDYYPYLTKHVDPYDLRERKVLEIGLGYGTLGQYIAERGAVYHGLDIAPTPVEMMRHRLRMLCGPADDRVVQGSAVDIPFAAETFDYVYSIGCLHHTGDLEGSVAEVHRVLKPGGTAVLMLYNRYSLRQLWRVDRRRLEAVFRTGRLPNAETVRAYYDTNAAGDGAPHTDFTSRRSARRLLRHFSHAEIKADNFDTLRVTRGLAIGRDRLIEGPIARLLGLDLYITTTK
jgi:SAM-dependent methyltransferase